MAAIGSIKIESGLKRWPMNRAGSSAEIRIYSDIGLWHTSQMFAEQLDALGEVAVLDVRINSMGGVGAEGLAIYNLLAMHSAVKRVWIDAAAYSAAAIVAMAASPGELRMADNARAMIHEAWALGEGNKREMRKVAEMLELADGAIATTFAKRMTEFSKEQILGLMEAETWYDAEGAVAAGFADEIFAAGEVALPDDELNLAREFKRLPPDLAERIRAHTAASSACDQAAAVGVAARWAEVRQRQAA